jgi:hypothetical protein
MAWGELVPDLRDILGNVRLDLSHESRAQEGIAAALTAAGVPFEREVVLAPTDRIDFLLPGGLGVEVKLACGRSPLLRQLHRYAGHDRIHALILVTADPRLQRLPPTILGKPMASIALTGSLF